MAVARPGRGVRSAIQHTPSPATSMAHGSATEKLRIRTSPDEYTLNRISGTNRDVASSTSARDHDRRTSSTHKPINSAARAADRPSVQGRQRTWATGPGECGWRGSCA